MIKLLPAVILSVLAQFNQIDLKGSISMIPAWKKLDDAIAVSLCAEQ